MYEWGDFMPLLLRLIALEKLFAYTTLLLSYRGIMLYTIAYEYSEYSRCIKDSKSIGILHFQGFLQRAKHGRYSEYY